MTEFKVGDRVKLVNTKDMSSDSITIYENKCGLVTLVVSSNELKVKFDSSDEKQFWDWRFILENAKPIKYDFVVIWDEQTKDPSKFFEKKGEAIKFIDILMTKSDVIKSSVKLVEIKKIYTTKTKTILVGE